MSSAKDSWFPGYRWTVCNCACGEHVGWRFDWVAKSEREPKRFWALRRDVMATAEP